MQDDLDLRSYPELGDGAVIYLLSRNPLSLRIYNVQLDTPVESTVKFGQEILASYHSSLILEKFVLSCRSSQCKL